MHGKSEMVRHGDWTAGRVTGAEVAVDVLKLETRVGQRCDGTLCMDLGYGGVGEHPSGMLVSTDDKGRPTQTHPQYRQRLPRWLALTCADLLRHR